MRKTIVFLFVLSIGFMTALSEVQADDKKPNVKETNKPEVQDSLKKGWDKVVFGKELDHEQYLKVVVAIAASVASENPAPLVAYVQDFVKESLQTLAVDVTNELVLLALKNPDKVFTSGKLEISGGFATYQHKKVVGTEVPYRIDWDNGKLTIWKRMEWAVIDLPNTYQPYVRIRTR